MSSRFRSSKRLLVLFCAFACLGACEREKREYSATPPAPPPLGSETLSTLQPGEPMPPPSNARGKEYEQNAYHIGQGSRLYHSFNCNGCHADGGGDIGPALMDDQWRYGGKIEQIYASIMDGRPFGMPSFRNKITEQQAWEISAYVSALSGNVPKDAAPSRREGMSTTPPPSQTPKQPPQNTEQEPLP